MIAFCPYYSFAIGCILSIISKEAMHVQTHLNGTAVVVWILETYIFARRSNKTELQKYYVFILFQEYYQTYVIYHATKKESCLQPWIWKSKTKQTELSAILIFLLSLVLKISHEWSETDLVHIGFLPVYISAVTRLVFIYAVQCYVNNKNGEV